MNKQLALGKLNLQTIEDVEAHIEKLTRTYLKTGNDIVLDFIIDWQVKLNSKLLNIKQQ